MTYLFLTTGEMDQMRRERVLSCERAYYQAELDLKLAQAAVDAGGAAEQLAKAIAKLDEKQSQLTLTLSTLGQ